MHFPHLTTGTGQWWARGPGRTNPRLPQRFSIKQLAGILIFPLWNSSHNDVALELSVLLSPSKWKSWWARGQAWGGSQGERRAGEDRFLRVLQSLNLDDTEASSMVTLLWFAYRGLSRPLLSLCRISLESLSLTTKRVQSNTSLYLPPTASVSIFQFSYIEWKWLLWFYLLNNSPCPQRFYS